MKIKLAEALLRRKELAAKTQILMAIKKEALYEPKVTRRAAHEGIDDIIANVPKLEVGQVTREYDWHARALRQVDAAIQRANWETDVDVPGTAMEDYREPEPKKG